MSSISKPHLTSAEQIAESSRRSMDDMVEQVYAVLDSRGAPRGTCRPSWILMWLQKGKTPQEIVDLAIGPRRPVSTMPGRVERN